MSMHNNYNPNIYKVYLPIILFNICVSLSLIDIVLYHFWHYTNIYLIMMNSVTLVGLIIILIYQFSHSKFLFYLRSLFLTRNIFHMMIIPKEISETTGKVKINAIVNLYNTSQRQTYGEFVNNKLYISPYYLGAESLLSAPTNNCVKRVKEKIKCEEGNQIKTVHVHSRS